MLPVKRGEEYVIITAGSNLKEAATLANIAAGIKVGKIGTASVSIEEIKREIESI